MTPSSLSELDPNWPATSKHPNGSASNGAAAGNRTPDSSLWAYPVECALTTSRTGPRLRHFVNFDEGDACAAVEVANLGGVIARGRVASSMTTRQRVEASVEGSNDILDSVGALAAPDQPCLATTASSWFQRGLLCLLCFGAGIHNSFGRCDYAPPAHEYRSCTAGA